MEGEIYITWDLLFKIKEAHCLVFVKALYGPGNSELRYWKRLKDVLIKMWFTPIKAEDNLNKKWKANKEFNYAVNDLAIVIMSPLSITAELAKR